MHATASYRSPVRCMARAIATCCSAAAPPRYLSQRGPHGVRRERDAAPLHRRVPEGTGAAARDQGPGSVDPSRRIDRGLGQLFDHRCGQYPHPNTRRTESRGSKVIRSRWLHGRRARLVASRREDVAFRVICPRSRSEPLPRYRASQAGSRMSGERGVWRPPRFAIRERSLTRITWSLEEDLTPGVRSATTNLPSGE